MPFVAIAGLGAVADAIVAVVFLLAIVAVAYLIEKFGGYIPLIGGWMAAQAVRFLQLAQSALNNTYQAMLWALQTCVSAIVIGITYPLGKVLDAANATVTAVYWLRNVAIPRVLYAAYNYASQVAQAAYSYALSLYYQALQYAGQVLTAAYAYALALYNQAIGYASAVLAAGYAYALALYNQAITYAVAAVGAVNARIDALTLFTLTTFANMQTLFQALLGQAVTGLEADLATLDSKLTALIQQYAQAALKDAITAVDLTAAVSLADLWPNLITDVDALLHDIPQELIDIRDRLAALPRAIPGDLADALTALGVLAIPMLRFMRDCGVPMCRDLHGLGDLFNGLNTAVTDAALLGFFALAAHDPHAAAGVIIDVVGPVADGATTLTRDLIGV